jgi:hypothetical protein
VPLALRRTLQAIGLVAWLWIIAQALFGGSGDGDVASLFLWVFGWVGVALVSALVGPVWEWLSPFTTIHAILSAIADRVGLGGDQPARYPHSLGRWPAVAGFAAVVWLELVARLEGGRELGLLLLGYTIVSVAAMSVFGREAWRERGEVFSVWFRLLGRMAPFALAGPPEGGVVARRRFGGGLLSREWTTDELVLLALGTGSIIFDGLSQTEAYFELFVVQAPLGVGLVRDTITAAVFLVGMTLVVLAVARTLGARAVGAGLLPVAVGYLIAHYLTFVLVDGQRILLALNDPLQNGATLLGIDPATWQPVAPLSVSIVWSIQLAAVVCGHVYGAWAGHAALAETHGPAPVARQVPLAVLMVVLTSLTLWSLGQAIIIDPAAGS